MKDLDMSFWSESLHVKVGYESTVSERGTRKGKGVCQLSEVCKLSPSTSQASAMPFKMSLPFG